ncbi:hypothetical protein [Sorangium sp. So ce385]|uniref:hypothetical protein n=1 Tax=Sorangium sp. So ce385 TaxID=3133308 RepID=UPI003F5C2337
MNTLGPAMRDAQMEAQLRHRSPPPGRRRSRDNTVVKRISMVACLFVAACGGGEEGEPEPIAWKDMSFEERNEYMTDVVLPRMATLFAEYDAKYETMTCTTCHGDDANGGTYAMPNPQLPALPSTEEAFFEWVADPAHPEREKFGTFMYERVLPEMADVLRVPVFDPEKHPDGFSCSSCHPMAVAEP